MGSGRRCCARRSRRTSRDATPRLRLSTHALEEVTFVSRVRGEESLSGSGVVYSGGCGVHLGSEVEVEGVWKKLKRPRLLAIDRPLGRRQELVPDGGPSELFRSTWTAIISTPGSVLFSPSLRQWPGCRGRRTGGAGAAAVRREEDAAVSLFKRLRESAMSTRSSSWTSSKSSTR